ncbi:MAG: hypothetical protein HC822_01275 [Oscillochloris sp.]|nr:hypothetical protein [Oscillochloris sp.]
MLEPIWQPPLPRQITLAELPDHDPPRRKLAPSVGLLDLPQENRRTPLLLDLDSAHLAVVGAPGSGKTSLLLSLALAAAAVHTTDELWIYAIDSGGHGLAVLTDLPHVGAVIQAREHERVRRLLYFLAVTLRERQELLRQAAVPDRRTYVANTQQVLPAIILFIDKIAVLREELPAAEEDEVLDNLLRLARIGRALGIHLVIGAERNVDLSYRLLAMLELRLALRVPDLHEYTDLLGGRVTSQLPANIPGRAFWMHPEHGPAEAQIALPALIAPGDEATSEDHDILLRQSIAQLAQQPARRKPTAITLLPERVERQDLPAPEPSTEGLCAAIGIESLGLTTAALLLDHECPHALVIGPRRSGKSSTLRTAARSLAAHYQPDQLRLLILDGPRGSLAELCELAHTELYAQDNIGAGELARLLQSMPNTPTRRLLLIDDYHLSRERLRDHFSQSYGEPNLLSLLLEAAQIGFRSGVNLLISADIGYADDQLLRTLDSSRSGIILWPGRYDGGTKLLGVSLPLAGQRNAEQTPGRALLIRDGEQRIVQVATN